MKKAEKIKRVCETMVHPDTWKGYGDEGEYGCRICSKPEVEGHMPDCPVLLAEQILGDKKDKS